LKITANQPLVGCKTLAQVTLFYVISWGELDFALVMVALEFSNRSIFRVWSWVTLYESAEFRGAVVWLTPFLVRFSTANSYFVPKRSGNQAQETYRRRSPWAKGSEFQVAWRSQHWKVVCL